VDDARNKISSTYEKIEKDEIEFAEKMRVIMQEIKKESGIIGEK
jgi:hypothetical protein